MKTSIHDPKTDLINFKFRRELSHWSKMEESYPELIVFITNIWKELTFVIRKLMFMTLTDAPQNDEGKLITNF